MVFSSITFLYFFLPALIIIYYIAPKKLKNLVMLIGSLTFYAWGEVRYIFIMLVLSLVDYICGRNIDKYLDNAKKRKLFMLIDVGVNLLVLFFFKYGDFFIVNINSMLGVNIPILDMPLPIGVSFNTFQSISYIIDVYRGTTTCEKSYYNYLTYTTLFPQIIAGPIVRYVTVEEDLDEREIKVDNFSQGLRRFILGLGKKVLIANNLGALWNSIYTGTITDMSVLLYWIGIVSFGFQIYFDFSGYSDMAIGIAKVFGLTFDENFNYPYIAKNITEFWRRWHITLSSWFRDYVYIPLGGNKVSRGKLIRNLLIVWTLTGFWHGASWNFMLWGFYFAIILILEKFVLLKYLHKTPRVFQHIYTIVLLIISWVIFSFEDLEVMREYFSGMFGLNGVSFLNDLTLYYITSYFIMFILAGIFSTPIFKGVLYRLEHGNRKVIMFSAAMIYVFIFLASTAYLVNSTYNPFLYFRF